MGRDLGVALDETADCRGEAGRETARGEHGYSGDWHADTVPTRRRRR
jgi:hypothetical protein